MRLGCLICATFAQQRTANEILSQRRGTSPKNSHSPKIENSTFSLKAKIGKRKSNMLSARPCPLDPKP